MQGVSTQIETRYGAEITVMTEMHWSWQELLDAPHDLVEEIRLRIAARGHWERERAKLERSKAAQQKAAPGRNVRKR